MTAAPICRFCGAPLAVSLVDLGVTPLANSYRSAAELELPEPRFPLHARVCSACRLVQVDVAAKNHELNILRRLRCWPRTQPSFRHGKAIRSRDEEGNPSTVVNDRIG